MFNNYVPVFIPIPISPIPVFSGRQLELAIETIKEFLERLSKKCRFT
jgi:hypothetical protein